MFFHFTAFTGTSTCKYSLYFLQKGNIIIVVLPKLFDGKPFVYFLFSSSQIALTRH